MRVTSKKDVKIMPLDNLMYSQRFNSKNRSIVYWSKKFAWLPQRSVESKHLIWFKYAREGLVIADFGAYDAEHVWLTEDEYLILCLKAIHD